MRKAVIFIAVVGLLVLGVVPVYAQSVPPLPHAFHGHVTINGNSAPAGTIVEARGQGVRTGIEGNPIRTTQVGKYGSPDPLEPKLIIQGDIREGTTITFYVNNYSTGETATWRSGVTTQLNLSVVIPPPPLPVVVPGITDVTPFITPEGVFIEAITAESFDDLAELIIAEGTIALINGEPLAEVTMLQMEDPPPLPADSSVIGLVYDFGPDGTVFDPPITLIIIYNPELIPEGVPEENLVIARWEAGEWVNLDSIVDAINNTVGAQVSHFTAFAVLAYTPPLSSLGRSSAGL
jgi:hypothetical protein